MADIKLDHKFDAARNRHYLNDQLSVLHCHHYATLFTQLALDAKDLVDGTGILKEAAEDVFYGVLTNYYQKNSVSDAQEKIKVAIEMFSAFGMGKMSVSGDAGGGEVKLPHAYVDEGWLKKWGKFKAPVNFIGAGYIAGMFAAAYDKPSKTYKVEETQSRVTGAAESVFKVSA